MIANTHTDGPLPNIVMIVLDTVRADMLLVYGHTRATSPYLESFATQATRYDRAYSSSSWTLPAHGSLFSGVSPNLHLADQTYERVAESLPPLAEQFSEAGYQTAAFSGNIWIGGLSGLSRGFEHFEDLNRGYYAEYMRKLAVHSQSEMPPVGQRVALQVAKWLRQKRAPERPFFLFVNLVDAHMPYLPGWKTAKHFFSTREEYWDAARLFFDEGSGNRIVNRHYGRRKPLTSNEWQTLKRMYEATLRVTDGLTEIIVAAVEAFSDLENTIIFILSDHGENLGDHEHLTHIFNLYDTNLRIALLARGPGFGSGVVEDRLVHITDLHTTVLRAAGIEPNPAAEGIDLREEIPEDRIVAASLAYPKISLSLFAAWSSESAALDGYKRRLRAAVGPRFKLIRSNDRINGNVLGEEVFDLLADPLEERPLDPRSVDPDAIRRLRAVTDRTYDTDPVEFDGAGPDAEERKSLTALGYLSEEEDDVHETLTEK